MEVAGDILEVLKGLNNDDVSRLPDLQDVLHGNDNSKDLKVKGALIVVAAEAARRGLGVEELSFYLGSRGVPRAGAVAEKCLNANLPSSRIHKPKIVGVKWKLKCELYNTLRGRVCEPRYNVTFVTAVGYNDISFDCNVEDLQDLVFRLRDAELCMRRHS